MVRNLGESKKILDGVKKGKESGDES
jgi:hypothetical protein